VEFFAKKEKFENFYLNLENNNINSHFMKELGRTFGKFKKITKFSLFLG